MNHELKTWPEYYDKVVSGEKTFELRKNDRYFKVGDTLTLQKYCPNEEKYLGWEITVEVTYILEGGNFGLEEGFVIMGFKYLK